MLFKNDCAWIKYMEVMLPFLISLMCLMCLMFLMLMLMLLPWRWRLGCSYFSPPCWDYRFCCCCCIYDCNFLCCYALAVLLLVGNRGEDWNYFDNLVHIHGALQFLLIAVKNDWMCFVTLLNISLTLFCHQQDLLLQVMIRGH